MLQKCLFVSLRPSLSLVTFRLRLRISALVFLSTFSLLVSHHYSFSKPLLSLLKHASPRASHEAQRVCNLGWLTRRKSRHVFARRSALIPAADSSLPSPPETVQLRGWLWLCARVSALSHCNPQEYCRLPAQLIRLSESLWPNFSQNKHAAALRCGREKDRRGHLVLSRAKQN